MAPALTHARDLNVEKGEGSLAELIAYVQD
jgi:hypothetical protein